MSSTEELLIFIAFEIAYIGHRLEQHLTEIALNSSRSDAEKAQENFERENPNI